MNSNCLEGIQCPKCGFEGRFYISATAIFVFTDEGAEYYGHDVEMGDDSRIECAECHHEGQIKDFRLTQYTVSATVTRAVHYKIEVWANNAGDAEDLADQLISESGVEDWDELDSDTMHMTITDVRAAP